MRLYNYRLRASEIAIAVFIRVPGASTDKQRANDTHTKPTLLYVQTEGRENGDGEAKGARVARRNTEHIVVHYLKAGLI